MNATAISVSGIDKEFQVTDVITSMQKAGLPVVATLNDM
jgi:hypothetical protein